MADKKMDFRREVSTRGDEVYNNSTILNGLIADIFTDDIKILNRMKAAVSAGVHSSVLALRSCTPALLDLEIKKISQSYSDNFDVMESSAQEVVCLFAFGLGLVGDYNVDNSTKVQAPTPNTPKDVSPTKSVDAPSQKAKDLVLSKKREPLKQTIANLKNDIKNLRISIRAVDDKLRDTEKNIRDWDNDDSYGYSDVDIFRESRDRILYGGTDSSGHHYTGLFNDRKKQEDEKYALETQIRDIEEKITDCNDALKEVEDDFRMSADAQVESYYEDLHAKMKVADVKEICKWLSDRFKELDGYKDSENLAKDCMEQPLRIEYASLIKAKNTAKTETALLDLAHKFNAMKGFRDTAKLAEECKAQALQIKYDGLVKEKSNAKLVHEFEELVKKFKSMNGYKDTLELAKQCETLAIQTRYDTLMQVKAHAKTENDFISLAQKLRDMKGFADTAELAEQCGTLAVNAKYDALIQEKASAKTEQEFRELAKRFKAMNGFSDSNKLAEQCEGLAMQTKYNVLVECKSYAKKLTDFLELAHEFNTIRSFADSASLADECETHSQEIQSRFDTLKEEMAQAKTEQEYNELGIKFNEIECYGFDDASKLARECQASALKIAYDSLVYASEKAETKDEYIELAKKFRNFDVLYERAAAFARECDKKAEELAQVEQWKNQGLCRYCGGIIGGMKKLCESCKRQGLCRYCDAPLGGLLTTKCTSKSCNRPHNANKVLV